MRNRIVDISRRRFWHPGRLWFRAASLPGCSLLTRFLLPLDSHIVQGDVHSLFWVFVALRRGLRGDMVLLRPRRIVCGARCLDTSCWNAHPLAVIARLHCPWLSVFTEVVRLQYSRRPLLNLRVDRVALTFDDGRYGPFRRQIMLHTADSIQQGDSTIIRHFAAVFSMRSFIPSVR